MAQINSITYGPIITLNRDLGLKVTEDGNVALKALTDIDRLFLKKDWLGQAQPGVTFSFFKDGLEAPVNETTRVEIEANGSINLDKGNQQTKMIKSGDKTLLLTSDRDIIQLRKHDIDEDGREDWRIADPDGTIKVMNREVYGGKWGHPYQAYHIQTPQEEIRCTTEQLAGKEDYEIVLPNYQGVIKVNKAEKGDRYTVDLSTSKIPFDIHHPDANTWTVTTPDREVVRVKRTTSGLFGSSESFSIQTSSGIWQLTQPTKGRYQLERDGR